MKVSLQWIKQYLDFELPPVEELVRRIGDQLGAVESVENLGEKYQGIVIAKVVECYPHPDSDHMHVCKLDDGGKTPDVAREHGLVQVVCGAPNVREGLLVAWLPPGSTVPESYGKEPFVLGARELRGVISNGMLASARELALGDNHDGILELGDDSDSEVRHPELVSGSSQQNGEIPKQVQNDGNTNSGEDTGHYKAETSQPGDDFAVAFALNDTIIDIENKMFTHRPDCFGQLGVAREIAGILGHQFTSPDWYQHTPQDVLAQSGDMLPLEVRNEVPELVPRFLAIPLANVTVRPSPLWLQTYLLRVGVRPISNVVDITNYIMLLTGQPLHAYDYDKVKALDGGDKATLVVRPPRSGEEILLHNGKTIKPRDEAIMVATETKLIGVGGVMGGADTEVDSGTKNIILECANFDMYSIRRTAMAHGLFTDAVTRNNKDQSPLQNDEVSAQAVTMLRELAGATVAGPVVDNNHVDEQSRERHWVHPPVPLTVTFVNSRLGLKLTSQEMQQLLGNVECSVTAEGENLLVHAPFWRTDIETREDVVEEIGRLYGFDKLPLELPKRSIQPAEKDAMLELKSTIRAQLAKAGANEALTYSFVHGDLLDKVGQNPADAFRVSNALSPDLQYYRLSLTPSLLDKIHMNIKAGYEVFALFEIGKGHNLEHATDDDGLPTEFEMLDLVFAASDKSNRPGAAFYQARKFLSVLANHFGLQLDYRAIESEEDYQVAKPYEHTRSAQVWVKDTDIALGMVGEYKASVRKALKLPVRTAGFSIGLTQLMEAAKNPTIDWYTPLSRFPRVTQDITLKVAANVRYSPLYHLLNTTAKEMRPEQTTSRLYAMDIYQRPDDPEHKQLTFRLSIASFERTMTDAEVTALLDTIATAAATDFGAERV